MSIYCVSDIHGNYDKYKKMIDTIQLSQDDILYVLGDVIDRGEHSIKILQDMMFRDNVIPLFGNHEYIAINCMNFLMREVTEQNIRLLNEDIMIGLLEWLQIGGQATLNEFKKLSYDEKIDILDYLKEFSLYEEVSVNNKHYVLVHAGLENFDKNKSLDDYTLYEMLFCKCDYSKQYFDDKYLITGHTPTFLIKEHLNKNSIYRKNYHIAIDCGCGYGGKLGVICLDDGKEFYF